MKYSRSLLLYEDQPSYGLFLRLLFVIVPGVLLAASVYLWSSGEGSGGLALLAEAFLIGFIFWIVFPRSYRVYEDHLRIVLGGPFSVKVGFDRIKAIRVTRRLILSINFVTRLSWDYVEIARKGGLSVAITPRDNNLFVENANRALSEWAKKGTG